MAFIALLAIVLAVATPSLQQGGHGAAGAGHGGFRDHAYCYDECNNAYQRNRNSYHVDQCNCVGYNFPGHSNCGRIEHSCIVPHYDVHHHVYVYTYDHNTHSCHKVSVLKRCADSYSHHINVFQHHQECVKACEHNKGY